jgi:hypothetical protein
MFCDDFEYNSTCFYDSRKLIRILCVTGQNRNLFLHLVLHLALSPTLYPTQKPWVNWRLSYRRQAMGESKTWVLFVLMASNY